MKKKLDEGKMYFNLSDKDMADDSESDSNGGYTYTANAVFRYYLFDSNNALNRMFYEEVPQSLRTLPSSTKIKNMEKILL